MDAVCIFDISGIEHILLSTQCLAHISTFPVLWETPTLIFKSEAVGGTIILCPLAGPTFPYDL